MRYLLLNLAFLIVVCGAVWLYTRQRITKTIMISCVILLAMTAIFDSLIVGQKIVAYNPNNILGIVIGWAPIEDFAYTIVSVVTVTLLWEYYESKH